MKYRPPGRHLKHRPPLKSPGRRLSAARRGSPERRRVPEADGSHVLVPGYLAAAPLHRRRALPVARPSFYPRRRQLQAGAPPPRSRATASDRRGPGTRTRTCTVGSWRCLVRVSSCPEKGAAAEAVPVTLAAACAFEVPVHDAAACVSMFRRQIEKLHGCFLGWAYI